MALIKCSECGKEISDKSDKCVHCGNPIEKETINNDKKALKSRKINKKIIIICIFCIISVIAILSIVNQNTVKVVVTAGDSELKIMKNNTVYSAKFDEYLIDFDNNKIKIKELFIGNFDGCYIVDTKNNVYRFDLSGNTFYGKKTFEDKKYFYMGNEYNGRSTLKLEDVSGGFTEMTLSETLTKNYSMLTSTEYDLINGTKKKF